MHKKLLACVSAVLLFFAHTGLADDDAPPLYQVEVLVFTTGALKAWTEEYWPWPESLTPLKPDADTPTESEATDATAESDAASAAAEPDATTTVADGIADQVPPVSTPFAMTEEQTLLLDDLLAGQFPENAPAWMHAIHETPPDDRLLLAARERLTPQKGYRIVAYYSWIQPAVNSNAAQPFEILGETPYGDTLDGQFRFYKNRYAHIELSLNMTRRIPQKIREAFARHEGLPLEELPETWTFHLSETRKIKSNEWHYFDHPLFGALAVIRRVSN